MLVDPGDVNRTQSNSIVDRIDRTQSNAIEFNDRLNRSNSIEVIDRTIELIDRTIEINQSRKKCKSSIGFDRLRSSDQSLRLISIGFD